MDASSRNYKKDHGHPANRIAYDSHAFLHEEKFDKWLDLSIIGDFITRCHEATTWSTSFFRDLNHIVSADSICELHGLGVTPQKITQCQLSPLLPAMLIQHVLCTKPTKSHLTPVKQRDFNSKCQTASFLSVSHQVAHLISHMSPTLKEINTNAVLPLHEKLLHLPAEILAAQCFQEDMLFVLQQQRKLLEYSPSRTPRQRAMRKISSVNLSFILPSIGAHVYLTHDIIIMDFKSSSYLLDKDLLLEVINKSSELVSLLVYAFLCSGTIKPENHMTVVLQFVDHIISKLLMFKSYKSSVATLSQENRGFVYLKTIEGLGASELIRRADEKVGWNNIDLAKNLWEAIYAEGLDYTYDYERSELWKLFSLMTTSQIASIIGIVKIAGHPSIEIMKGLQKLNERVHENIIVNPQSVERSIGVLKRELIINYYKKHKAYPRVRLGEDVTNQYLRNLILRNINPDSETGLRYRSQINIDDWYTVTLERNELFDPVDNQLILLKDKALGLSRSNVLRQVLVETTTSKKKGQSEYRRALLMYLLTPYFSQEFMSYLSSFSEDDPWRMTVLDYLVIKLTPKELEMKAEGRMFGASHLYERNRRIVQDMNIMHLLDCYITDQLMTPDELQTIRKLYSFRHIKSAYPNHTIVQVSFDFSKWNNSMRAASIDVPGREVFDRWFGTSCYGKTMRAFENTLVYYKDPKYLFSWDGQLGGIEGLAQATWSAIFIGGIKQSLENLGVTYQLTVKGDDVRAALICDQRDMTEQDLIQFRDRTLNQLKELCNNMGWQLNPNECFVSVGVICTSKQYQFFDTWLPADDKKMMKCESMSNLVFPTVEDIVSSVFSTAHSACSQATAILPAYCSATYIASRVLLRDVRDKKITAHELCSLLLWPQVLGGPGALPLQTYIVRGENDMVSVSISLLRHVISTGFGLVSEICENLLRVPMETSPNLNQLLSDPYSLPLRVPERPSQVLKNLMRAYLERWVKNPDIKRLISKNSQSDKQRFAKVLLSMRPFYPKLATAIWECTPFVLIDEIISKFMQSSTIFAFFSKGRSGKISTAAAAKSLMKVLIAARLRKVFWITLIRLKKSETQNIGGITRESIVSLNKICTTQLVSELRETLWGIPLMGITYPSLVDQNMILHPSDVSGFYANVRTEGVTSQVVILHKYSTCQTPDDNSHHFSTSPEAVPWLGSVTKSKLIFPKFDYRVKSPVLSKILRLVGMLRSGAYYGPKFEYVIKEVLAGLTSVNITRLHVLQPESGGGHLCHRVAINSFSLNTMPNYRPNLSQIVTINNESLRILQLDRRDRTINFAARHFFLVVMSTLPLQASQLLPDDYPQLIEVIFHHDMKVDHYHLCPFCCAVAIDEEVDIDLSYMIDFSTYRSLTLVGCSEFETHILNANVTSAIVNKARHQAIDRNLDLENMYVLSAAYETTIHALSLENTQLYQSARAAMFDRIPQGELLNILSCNFVGGGPSKKVSMRLIRSIPPLNLYQNVLNEVYQRFMVMSPRVIDATEILSLQFIQSHMMEISGLFQSISDAGCLKQVSDGCREDGVLCKDLIWPVGSAQSGSIACRAFIAAHLPWFEHIISSQENISYLRYMVHNEDADSIRNELQERAQSVRECAIRRFRYLHVNASPFSKLLLAISDSLNIPHDNLVGLLAEDPNINQILTDFVELTIVPNIGNDRFIESEIVETILGCLGCLQVYQQIRESPLIHEDDVGLLSTQYTIEILESQVLTPIRLECLSWQHLNSSYFMQSCGVNLPISSFEKLIELVIELGHTIGFYDSMIIREDAYLHDTQMWLNRHSSVKLNTLSFESAESVLDQLAHKTRDVNLDTLTQLPPDEVDDTLQGGLQFTVCNAISCRGISQGVKPLICPGSSEYHEKIINDMYAAIVTNIDKILLPRTYFPFNQFIRVSPCMNQASSAWMICMSYLRTFENPLVEESDVCCVVLGDGSGSLSRYILENMRETHVIYCSLNINPMTGKAQMDASTTNPPYEFLSPRILRYTLDRLHWRGMFPGDFTLNEVQTIIIRNARHTGVPVAWIISDAEPPLRDYDTSMIKFVRSMFIMYNQLGNNNTWISFKVQIQRGRKLILVVHFIERHFRHVHIITPPNCDPDNPTSFFFFSQCLTGTIDIECFDKYISGDVHFYVDENCVTKLMNYYKSLDASVRNHHATGRFDFGFSTFHVFELVLSWHQGPHSSSLKEFFHFSSDNRVHDFCNIEVDLTTIIQKTYDDNIFLLQATIVQPKQDNRPKRFRTDIRMAASNVKIAEGRTYTISLFTQCLRIMFLVCCVQQASLRLIDIVQNYRGICDEWVRRMYDLSDLMPNTIHINATQTFPDIKIWGETISTRREIKSILKYTLRLCGQLYMSAHYLRHRLKKELLVEESWILSYTAKSCCTLKINNILRNYRVDEIIPYSSSVYMDADGFAIAYADLEQKKNRLAGFNKNHPLDANVPNLKLALSDYDQNLV